MSQCGGGLLVVVGIVVACRAAETRGAADQRLVEHLQNFGGHMKVL